MAYFPSGLAFLSPYSRFSAVTSTSVFYFIYFFIFTYVCSIRRNTVPILIFIAVARYFKTETTGNLTGISQVCNTVQLLAAGLRPRIRGNGGQTTVLDNTSITDSRRRPYGRDRFAETSARRRGYRPWGIT